MENSTEQIYDLFQKYLIPILKFANIYVDDKGLLRPIGRDSENLSYKEDDRELIIVDSQAKYIEIKAQKEKYQIFNPFSIPKQTVFLANMVMMAANEKDDYENDTGDMVYDEDLDMWIAKDDTDPDKDICNYGCIKMFEKRDKDFPVNTLISFCHTDKSGNPVDNLASFSHMNVIMATIGAIINLIKKFQTKITSDFISTEMTIINIEKILSKIQTLREKERKQKPEKLIINDIRDDEELYDDITEIDSAGYFIDVFMSLDSLYLPNDKKCEYDPEFANSKVNRNIILPNYKEVQKDDSPIKSFVEANEMMQFIDSDFIL